MIWEFKNREVVMHKGRQLTLLLVRNPSRETECDEPLFRIQYPDGLIGNGEFTEEELSEMFREEKQNDEA